MDWCIGWVDGLVYRLGVGISVGMGVWDGYRDLWHCGLTISGAS